jgi:DNA-binding MarR family transcriptional regulator
MRTCVSLVITALLLVAGLTAVSPGSGVALISPTFPMRYSRAVTDGPMRVTEPMLDVLEVLLDSADYQMYGWAITKATQRASPTVYKILERLTERGMVTARWEERHPEENKPRRRFYRLTGHGAQVAAALLTQRGPDRGQLIAPRPVLGWMGA